MPPCVFVEISTQLFRKTMSHVHDPKKLLILFLCTVAPLIGERCSKRCVHVRGFFPLSFNTYFRFALGFHWLRSCVFQRTKDKRRNTRAPETAEAKSTKLFVRPD